MCLNFITSVNLYSIQQTRPVLSNKLWNDLRHTKTFRSSKDIVLNDLFNGKHSGIILHQVTKVYEHTIYDRTDVILKMCIVSLSKKIGGKRGWSDLNTRMRLVGKIIHV